MLSVSGGTRIFVARQAVDFRKAHDGLVAVIREQLGDDPFGGDVFVFFNRRRDRIKVLVWDENGFWLHYKRLEKGSFESVPLGDGARQQIDRARLAMLLEGVQQKSVKFRRNFARRVCITARRELCDAAPAR